MADPYVDGLSLPIGANPETDIVIGQGDYGNVYRTRDGQVYQIVPQAVQGGSRIKPVLNALGADPWGTAKTVGNALAQGMWSAFSAPGRASLGLTLVLPT